MRRERKALLVRLDPQLYSCLAGLSEELGVSMNWLVNVAVRKLIESRMGPELPRKENGGPGSDQLKKVVERLSQFAEEELDPGFEGFTRDEMTGLLMNVCGLPSPAQAAKFLSVLIGTGYVRARVKGNSARYFLNLGGVRGTGSSSLGPSGPDHRTS